MAYGDLLKEAGVTSFITPMGDTESGKDYTALADHVDIISTHAWKGSAGLIARTREKGKTLWLYNTGMDRLSWGFYNWRVGSIGRWEWHFSLAPGHGPRRLSRPRVVQSLHRHPRLRPPTPAGGPPGGDAVPVELPRRDGRLANDYAYLTTLNKTLRAESDNKRARGG